MSVNSGGKRPQMQPQQANAGPLQGNNFQKVPLVHHFTDLPDILTEISTQQQYCHVKLMYSKNATKIWFNLRQGLDVTYSVTVIDCPNIAGAKAKP